MTYSDDRSSSPDFQPYWVEVNQPIEELHQLQQLSQDVVKADTRTTGFLGNPEGLASWFTLVSINLLVAGDAPEKIGEPFKVIKYARVHNRF